MRELVAGCSDACKVNAGLASQLCAAGVAVYDNAVCFDRTVAVTFFCTFCERPCVRPDVVPGPGLCFIVAGMDEEYLLHFAVTVPIVLAEVHLLVRLVYCFGNHCGHKLVVAVAFVGAVM